ncbi:hypothetical protein ACFQFC_28360 [Amorphoplanes digitatis]|uniref:Uncharacterized membrane protein YhaH (DUF805 family) n=1 Tax=Actinoplanes digitatis TaxID=1868 RepID=A0A7W7HSM4_9ACTN|nr:hypothetical protein [Actinoplanes digitatis]MBB4760059.1 uncharacterized membrane protein YhaH (DUF805 family) [Actinoplanes digitatis]BFE68088.1 hypothetical protein GCM10020092_013890 [Actinoplanes digitatis]GID95907.1 hypothetical protein Adi01nite_53190 [Actinoplanes digitatis]
MTPRQLDSPATLLWAVRLLFAEAVALALLTAYLLVLDFTADSTSVAVAVALTGFTAIGAVAVFLVARALARRSSHARGPAIVVQLFAIAAGGFLLQTGTAWIGAPMMALGVAVGLLCVLPPTTRALGLD